MRSALESHGPTFARNAAMIDRNGWGPGSAGAADFEARLRRRLFTQCILRSEAEITSGALENARVALDEARELLPDAPEVAVVESRMMERRDGLASSTMPEPSALSSALEGEDDDIPPFDGWIHRAPDQTRATSTPAAPDRGQAFLTKLPLAAVLLAMVGVLGLTQISSARSRQAEASVFLPGSPEVLLSGVQSLLGAFAAHDGSETTPHPALSALRVVADAISPVTVVATTGARIPPQRAPRLPASSFDSDAPAGDGERLRATLKRYEEAYNRISEKPAGPGSPGAEREIPEPTVDAFRSGRISSGACDIAMSGEVGVATCVGTAESGPNIGGSATVVQRYWVFGLRRRSDGWRIEQLKVE